MISSILAADASSIVMIVVLLVLFVGMMLISIIPQKKKQKEYEAMQSAIKVGTRIMTIGRLVGTVVAINTDNTIEVDIGTKGNPVIILINREGIGLNLDAQQVAPDSKGDIKANSSEGDVDAEETSYTEAEPSDENKDDEI
ncbi:MAG TPA: preprotein translocase subunit YajC [Clostridiales bacterium]|nr:preprotein translocase subunit YajC [Clostridiales bacterium]